MVDRMIFKSTNRQPRTLKLLTKNPNKMSAKIGINRSVIVALVLIITSALLSFATAERAERWKALRTLKSVNRQGPYLGIITTFYTEDNAFFETGSFVPNPKQPYVDLSGRRFRIGTIEGKKIVYVSCGMGMVNAAVATQQMLDMFDIIGIIHFGIAGNVNSSMSIGDVSIPREFANTGIWDWLKPEASLHSNDVAQLNFGNYNVPKGDNDLGYVGFATEQFYDSKKPNVVQEKFWFSTSKEWVQLASRLQGMKLDKCVNSTLCLDQDPKLVVGLKGSTSDFFVDNAAYREFIFNTFQATTADMESSAVVMTCSSNGYPVIVIRSLSDLAGGGDGENVVDLFGGLAASNAAKVVIEFIKIVSVGSSIRSF